MMSKPPKKRCDDCPATTSAQDNETRKLNLKAAYDAVVAAQRVLECVANEPGKYKPAALSTLYGMAVQGLETLRDIEEVASVYGIPLTGMEICKTKELQQTYVDKLKSTVKEDD
jgi:hypothetical protein